MTALLGAIILLGGCGLLGSVVNTTTGLQRAGFSSVRVSLNGVASGRNVVDVSVSVDAAPSDGATVMVARVVWNDLHEHFDDLDVTVHGHGPDLHRQFPFTALVGLFGPRNPAWDKTSLRSSVQNVGYAVIIGVGAVALVVAAVIVIVVRTRRRRGPPPPWPGFAGAGPPGSPPWAGPPPGAGPGGPGWAGPPPRGRGSHGPPGAGPPPPPGSGGHPGPKDDDGHGPWGAPAPPE
ncbi:MAG: hypothetical protein ACR2MN_16370 [Acidimicrobiales bacterium]